MGSLLSKKSSKTDFPAVMSDEPKKKKSRGKKEDDSCDEKTGLGGIIVDKSAKSTAAAGLARAVGGDTSDPKKLPKIKVPSLPAGSKGAVSSEAFFKGTRMVGDYPVEYNAKVHGPYDPSRFYGKPDTPFGQVKVGEIGSWLARRNKHPQAFVAAISRAYWRWQLKYLLPKKSNVAPLLQFSTAFMSLFYVMNYFKIKHHNYYKYH